MQRREFIAIGLSALLLCEALALKVELFRSGTWHSLKIQH